MMQPDHGDEMAVVAIAAAAVVFTLGMLLML
jgi:hypothetical protein